MRYLILFCLSSLLMFSGCTPNIEVTIDQDDGAQQSNSEVPDVEDKSDSGEGEDPNKPLVSPMIYPYGEIDVEAVKAARQRVMAERSAQFARGGTILNPTWYQRGPFDVQGRVTALAVDQTDDNVVYAAAAEGGIFKTTDSGATWVPIFDDMPSMSMGAVALDPTDQSIVYAGTGEANSSADSYPGTGIYRSTDGGATWTHLGLENSGHIGRIVIDPVDTDIIHVAVMGYVWSAGTERGVYRTDDGGVTWQRVLYVNDTTGCVDIVQRSDDPDVLFAAMWDRIRVPGVRRTGGLGCGVHKSEDRGQTWTLVENGLPAASSDNGRIGLAISRTNPDVMLACYTQTAGPFMGLYQTTDGGDSWTQTNDGSLSGVQSSFGWYFGNVRIDPTDENRHYVVGFYVAESQDGGQNYANISAGQMHVDHHGFAFGNGANPKLYCGNDGGVYYSTNGGQNWIKTTGDLPITQPYRIATATWNDLALWCGTQDNGTQQDLDGDGDFDHIFGGDGFATLPHLTDPDRIWAQYQWGNINFSDDGGVSFSGTTGFGGRKNWNTPHVQDPNHPEVRYAGSHRVYRNDGDAAWTRISNDLTKGSGTLVSIEVSPADSNVIWAGADDGAVHVTQDYGVTWTDVTGGLPHRWITSFRPHPTIAGECLITVSGFQWGEDMSHVYRTENFGQNWTSVGDDLPDVPVNDVYYDEKNTDRYFVGTDLGVFQTCDQGQTWSLFGTGMPSVAVVDFSYRPTTRELVAGTHGRSIFTLTIPEVLPDTVQIGPGNLHRRSLRTSSGQTITTFRCREPRLRSIR